MKPVLQALLLAERVYTDAGTGKKIIAGTFNKIQFSRIAPSVREIEAADGTRRRVLEGGQHGGSPYAYLSLTDVVPQTKLLLQFVNLKRNRPLLSTELTISCDNRLETVEVVLSLPMLPVSEAGAYVFEVVCEGEILGSCRIVAEEVDQRR